MEKAVFLSLSEARTATRSALARYDRVYVGSSFCQNLLPQPEDIFRLRQAGAAVTLATPLLTGLGLQRAVKLIRAVLLREKTLEVSVGDMGLLNLLKRHFPGRAVPLIGRPVSRDFSRMSGSFLKGFFRHFRIKMLESDEADIARILPPDSGVRVAFHYPYCCLAITRVCPYTGVMSDECSGACSSGPVELTSPDGSLLLRNNAYFIRNSPVHGEPVDRLVYTPAGSAKRGAFGKVPEPEKKKGRCG